MPSDPVREETGGGERPPQQKLRFLMGDLMEAGRELDAATDKAGKRLREIYDDGQRLADEIYRASASSSKDEGGGGCGEASPGSGALCCVRDPGHEGVHVHDDGERLASWVEGRWLHEHRYAAAPSVSQQGTGELSDDAIGQLWKRAGGEHVGGQLSTKHIRIETAVSADMLRRFLALASARAQSERSSRASFSAASSVETSRGSIESPRRVARMSSADEKPPVFQEETGPGSDLAVDPGDDEERAIPTNPAVAAAIEEAEPGIEAFRASLGRQEGDDA